MSENKISNHVFTKNNADQIFNDFFNFKIMLLSKLIKALYILGLGVIILYTIQIMRSMPTIWGFILGVIFFLLAPLILHIFFETIMVPFSILETVKEIRDRLPLNKTDSEQK